MYVTVFMFNIKLFSTHIHFISTDSTPAAMIINATAATSSVNVVQGALKVLTALHLTTFQYPEQTCVFGEVPLVLRVECV